MGAAPGTVSAWKREYATLLDKLIKKYPKQEGFTKTGGAVRIRRMAYISPVAYASSLVPARWRWLYGLNPMAGVIDGFRWAITGHGQPPGLIVLVSTASVLLVFFGGLFFFNRMEIAVVDRV